MERVNRNHAFMHNKIGNVLVVSQALQSKILNTGDILPFHLQVWAKQQI